MKVELVVDLKVGVGVGVAAADGGCSAGFGGSGLLAAELAPNLNPVVEFGFVFELVLEAPKLNPLAFDVNEGAAVVADDKKLVEPNVMGLLGSLFAASVEAFGNPKLILEDVVGASLA